MTSLFILSIGFIIIYLFYIINPRFGERLYIVILLTVF